MNKFNGFSLIEILIVIAILITVLLVVLPQFKSFGEQERLKNGALELESHLRSAQNLAQSGARCDSANQASFWVLRFLSGSQAQIKAACPLAETVVKSLTLTIPVSKITLFPANCELGNGSTLSGTGIKFANISAKVDFDTNNLGSGCSLSQIASATRAELEVTLSLNSSKKVMIEKGGKIYVQ